jgi:hypothetical protein
MQVRYFKLVFGFIFAACFFDSTCIAQFSNTLYFMDRVPQYQELNPAFQPKCNMFYGWPGLSGFQGDVGNNSISANDVLYFDKQLDSLITFMHDSASKAKFINHLKNENSFFSDMQVSIINFGFRVSSFYFTFGINEKFSMDFSYPRDFVKFAINGNRLIDSIANFNFNGLGVNASLYTEVSFGVSKNFDDLILVGARGKFLIGEANITTNNNSMQFNTSMDSWQLNSDVTMNVYAPGLNIPLKDTIKNEPDLNHIGFKSDMLKNFPNNLPSPFSSKGFAIDLGIVYKGIDKLTLSASMIDLGFIRWRNDVYNLTLIGKYNYTGGNYDALHMDSLNLLDMAIDSIKNSFTLTRKTSSYTTWLPTKFYVGAEYSPVRFFSLGFLSMSRYFQKKIDQQFVVSANLKPLKMLEFSTSYSILDNDFSSMGIGMNLRLGPWDFYLISDMIPLYYGKQYIPYKAEYFDLRLGFDFVFGCQGTEINKEKAKDKPLIFE